MEEEVKNTIPSDERKASGSGQSTYLGRQVTIENGSIATTENLTTDGRICTKLISTADVVVGGGAYFEGSILAHNIEIWGEFKGDAVAKKKLVAKKGSIVTGSVRGASVNIEDGANFNGQVAISPESEFDKTAQMNKVYVRLEANSKNPSAKPVQVTPPTK